MKTVWKYELQITDTQPLMIPEGATILSAQVQHGEACLWALVNPEAPKQRRVIEIFGTGHPMDERERDFIDTIQIQEGAFIFHVFEQI